MPHISVVIPSYNGANSIARALDSIRDQTLLPVEVIVVDDASTDNTLEIVEHWQASFISIALRIITQPINHGTAVARNIGWDQARGDFVAFLDDDDSWHPQKLVLQSAWLQKNPNAKACGHNGQPSNTQAIKEQLVLCYVG